MAKVINKTKGFESIPRDLVYEKGLSDRARFLYVYMACKPEDWEFYQDKMAEELGYEKRTLRKYLDELIYMGWIVEEQQENDGSFGALQYTIEIKKKNGENLPIRKKTDIQKMRIAKNDTQRNIDNISSKQSLSDNKEIEKKEKEKSFSKKVDIDFDDFYKLYPLKKSKQCAIKVWNRLSVEDKKEAIDKLPAYIADCYENKRSFKYPSTYLSQRTWEDDFISSEEEKEEPAEETKYPDGMDAEQWNEITFWMCNKVPRIAGKINPVTFDTMKKMAKDSQLLSMVLKEVDYRFTLDSSLDVMEVFKEELKNYWDEQTD